MTTPLPLPDIKAIRAKLGMSQSRFARHFGFVRATLKQWEQGRRYPEGPAIVLLTLIDRQPEKIARIAAQVLPQPPQDPDR